MNITIFIGDTSQYFMDYPYIASVIDKNGDTIGKGALEFFGQFGNSTQTYSIKTTFDSLPANFTCTVNFASDFDSTYCLLPYPCLSIANIKIIVAEKSFSIFPNPTTDNITIVANIHFINNNYSIINSIGEIVSIGKLTNNTPITISLCEFTKGIYFLNLGSESSIVMKE